MNNKICFSLVWFILLLGSTVMAQPTQDADYYCDKGILFYKQRQFREAAIEWEKSLNINPDHKLANYYLIKATEEKNKIDYHTSEGIRHYERKELIESLDNFNSVFEYDHENRIAKKYVQDIGMELTRDEILKSKILQDYKRKGEEYKERKDLVAAKKALAVYNTISLIDEKDKEALEEKIALEKKLPEVFEKERVMIYNQIGDEYFKEGKYDEAIFLWRKALTIEPENTEIENKIIDAFKFKIAFEKDNQIKTLLKEGQEYMANGLTSSAIAIFEEVLRLDPDNKQARSLREQLLAEKKAEEERKYLESQVKAFIVAGKKYMEQKDYEKAKEFFNNALILDDANQEARDLIKKCDERLEKEAEKIKEKDIEKIQKLLEEGIISYQQGDFERAISKLDECLILSPGNEFAEQYLDLAKKALWTKREEIIDIKSPFYNMVNNMITRGEHFFNKKDYEKSVDIWKSILFIFPLNKIAREYIVRCAKFISPKLFTYFINEHIEFGKKYLQEGLKSHALKEFQLVKKLFPSFEGIDKLIESATEKIAKILPGDKNLIKRYYNEGLKLYNQQKYNLAIQQWKKVLELDAHHERAILNINKVNHILNYDNIKSKRQVAKAKQEQIDEYYYKGLKHYNKGNLREAVRMWEQVLRIDPDNVKAKNNIRTCKIILDRY
ncbi:MAG: tetratricopeptide repeat protein [Spirochaetes bacterium]|nr:tetratricopeptide repeat protein [Spirochaetota bacterium]